MGKIRVSAEVNGYIYKNEVIQIIKGEEFEQITLCKRHIRSMLNQEWNFRCQHRLQIESYE